jgi:hypothetical protein
MPMSDNVAAATTQPLVSRIVSSYVKKDHVPHADVGTTFKRLALAIAEARTGISLPLRGYLRLRACPHAPR